MSFVINLLKVGPDKKLFLEDNQFAFLFWRLKLIIRVLGVWNLRANSVFLDNQFTERSSRHSLGQGSAHFCYTEPNRKYLGLVGQMVSVAIAQRCGCSIKAATDSMLINKWVCVPTLFTKTSSGPHLACRPCFADSYFEWYLISFYLNCPCKSPEIPLDWKTI